MSCTFAPFLGICREQPSPSARRLTPPLICHQPPETYPLLRTTHCRHVRGPSVCHVRCKACSQERKQRIRLTPPRNSPALTKNVDFTLCRHTSCSREASFQKSSICIMSSTRIHDYFTVPFTSRMASETSEAWHAAQGPLQIGWAVGVCSVHQRIRKL